MHNYRVRVWVLSLVTSPEHAAAIVGDMVEDGRSTLRCWTAIGSHIAHAMTPGLVGLALLGFFAQFLFPSVVDVAQAVGFWLFIRTPSEEYWRVLHWGHLSVFLVSEVATGYWIGRWDQRKSLLLILFVVILDCVAGAMKNNTVNINIAIWSIPLLAGTIVYRRRRTTFHRA